MENSTNALAKTLRKTLTDTERVLWKYLRARQMDGFKFRRQEPLGRYIADFVCHEKRIIVEVDGGQHAINREQDIERDAWFKGQGYVVLRFWNNEVLTNIEGVMEVIRERCLFPLTPTHGGEREPEGKESPINLTLRRESGLPSGGEGK